MRPVLKKLRMVNTCTRATVTITPAWEQGVVTSVFLFCVCGFGVDWAGLGAGDVHASVSFFVCGFGVDLVPAWEQGVVTRKACVWRQS